MTVHASERLGAPPRAPQPVQPAPSAVSPDTPARGPHHHCGPAPAGDSLRIVRAPASPAAALRGYFRSVATVPRQLSETEKAIWQVYNLRPPYIDRKAFTEDDYDRVIGLVQSSGAVVRWNFTDNDSRRLSDDVSYAVSERIEQQISHRWGKVTEINLQSVTPVAGGHDLQVEVRFAQPLLFGERPPETVTIKFTRAETALLLNDVIGRDMIRWKQAIQPEKVAIPVEGLPAKNTLDGISGAGFTHWDVDRIQVLEKHDVDMGTWVRVTINNETTENVVLQNNPEDHQWQVRERNTGWVYGIHYREGGPFDEL